MYLRKTTKDVEGFLSQRVPIDDIEIFLFILLRSATKLRVITVKRDRSNRPIVKR